MLLRDQQGSQQCFFPVVLDLNLWVPQGTSVLQLSTAQNTKKRSTCLDAIFLDQGRLEELGKVMPIMP